MADIAIGSDTGGSIRIPAALPGAVGFKPTSGFVPTAGASSLPSSLDTIGPITSTVADCFDADQVLSGVAVAPRPQMAAPYTLRLVVARDRLIDRCEPEVLGAFENVLASVMRLADRGRIDRGRPR